MFPISFRQHGSERKKENWFPLLAATLHVCQQLGLILCFYGDREIHVRLKGMLSNRVFLKYIYRWVPLLSCYDVLLMEIIILNKKNCFQQHCFLPLSGERNINTVGCCNCNEGHPASKKRRCCLDDTQY